MYKNTHWGKMNQHERGWGLCMRKEGALSGHHREAYTQGICRSQGRDISSDCSCSLQPSERTSILLSNSPLLLPLASRIEIQILLASPFARHEILPRKMFSYPSRIKACVLCKLLIGLIVSIQPLLYPTSLVLSLSPILVLAICSFKNKIQRTELS